MKTMFFCPGEIGPGEPALSPRGGSHEAIGAEEVYRDFSIRLTRFAIRE